MIFRTESTTQKYERKRRIQVKKKSIWMNILLTARTQGQCKLNTNAEKGQIIQPGKDRFPLSLLPC
ncbi:MAG: hypothetical protein BGP01_12205 [Paludibacter sp. 47-17]|nr:MAG: hypothetical protein BGP01_12205 [Paludibacter sp. 47-17]